MDINKIANLLLNFTIQRLAVIFGIFIFAGGALLLVSLTSYSPEDPNFIFPDNADIKNLLGFQGSFTSDLFFQSVGLISYLISITFILTGIKLCPVTGHNELDDSLLKELRGLIGGRRGRRPKNKNGNDNSKNDRGRKNKGVVSPETARETKRPRRKEDSK